MEALTNMETGRLILVLSPLIAINLVLTLSMIISIARKPLPWGQKWAWLLLLVTQPLGPIIYFALGSGMLNDKAARYQDSQERFS